MQIESFSSLYEVEQFKNYLVDRIREGELLEIEPTEHYFGADSFSKDRWFKDNSNNAIWRFVHPDYPFKGFFEKVEYPLETSIKKE